MPENARRYVAIDYGLDMFSAHWVAMDSEGRALIYREYDAPKKPMARRRPRCWRFRRARTLRPFGPAGPWAARAGDGQKPGGAVQPERVELTRASSDFAAGCAAMKEWLRPGEGGRRCACAGRREFVALFAEDTKGRAAP